MHLYDAVMVIANLYSTAKSMSEQKGLQACLDKRQEKVVKHVLQVARQLVSGGWVIVLYLYIYIELLAERRRYQDSPPIDQLYRRPA